MSTSQTSQLFRSLLKELRSIYKNKNLAECPTYQYMVDQFKAHQVTSEKHCKGKHDVQHLAETYLCYLQSLKKQEELIQIYGGKGERTVESSAEIVGLRLPKSPNEPEK